MPQPLTVDANLETAIATAMLLKAALERGNKDAAAVYLDRIRALITNDEVINLELRLEKRDEPQVRAA